MKKFNQIFIVAACMLLGILSSCSYLDVVPDEKGDRKKMHLKIRMLLNALFIRAMHISLIPEVVQVHWTSLPPMKW